MITQNMTETNLPEWFDPFPKARTMPAGWNLDGMISDGVLPSVRDVDDSPEAESDRL